MILLIITSFSDGSGDSTVGFHLCEHLTAQGHDIYVTTDSTGNTLEDEKKVAKDLSMKEKGTVTLLHPDNEDPQPDWLTKYYKKGNTLEDEKKDAKDLSMKEKRNIPLLHPDNEDPQPDWLTKYHKKHSYPSKLDSVKVIIGTLPGTETTAMELATTLKSRLILLASAKLPTNQEELDRILEKVDELWSVGSDNYYQNNTLLQKVSPISCQKHKEILLHSPNLVSDLIPSLPITAGPPTFGEAAESDKGQTWLQTLQEPKYAEVNGIYFLHCGFDTVEIWQRSSF